MSIKRIESAYATYLDDERISPTQMAVLQALAYCANGKSKNEDCFPGRGYLEMLTHFSDTAIDKACEKLREMGVISWTRHVNKKGEWDSNSYKFLFPLKKMPKRRDRYESVTVTGQSTMATTLATVGSDVGHSSQPEYPPSPTTLATLGSEVATNTERNSLSIPLLNSESEAGRGEGEPKPSFEVSGVLKKASYTKSSQENDERQDVIGMAIKACGKNPNDERERASFGTVIKTYGLDNARDEIYAFASEVRQGEHKNADNLAAVLMTRLKAIMPLDHPFKGLIERKLKEDFGV